MNLEKLDKIIHEDFNDAVIGKYIFYHKTRTIYKDDETIIYILFFTEGLAIIHNKVEEIIKPENIKDVIIKNKYIKLNYKITHKKKLKINFKNQELLERSFKLIKDIQNLKKNNNIKLNNKIKNKKEIEITKSLRNKSNIIEDNENIIDRILNEEPKIKNKEKKTEKLKIIKKEKKTEENKIKNKIIKEKECLKSKFNLIDNKKHILSQHQMFKTKKKEDIFFKLEFNDLRFFISSQKTIEHLKMKAIARIGKHFFPEKQIIDKMIDLNQYKEFKFFIKENKKLYQLEIEEDLNAIIKTLGNKFNVIIKLR